MRKTIIVFSLISLLTLTGYSGMDKAVCPGEPFSEISAVQSDLTVQKQLNERGLLCSLDALEDDDLLELDIMMDTDDARTFRYELYASHPEVMLAYSPRLTLVGYSKDASVCTGYRVTLLSEDGGERRYKELEAATADILIRSHDLDDAAKVAVIRRWVSSRCRYTKTVTNMWDESLYGCLVKGTATCLGYSEGFYYMMKKLGVPCRIVTDKYHAWNEVYVGGKWSSVDLTK